ncbi:hypothetical protein ACSNOI_25910 [Actinomadura kijaniata]|uniref:hypothetical protein n=1 Tax=Actinomadura kijaniata TaxID=46161 RepID=UPI003F1B1290
MGDGTSGWAGVGYDGWEDLARIRASLDAGADPDAELWGYQRPSHVAAEHEGRSASWNAVHHGRPDNARVLVAAGADPWRPMMRGWSPGRLSLVGPEPEPFGDPKSGDQGRIFRDGEVEGRDLHPGGGHPFPDEPSREILTGCLTRGGAVAHCCAFAGPHPSDTRPVEGPPGLWVRLPEGL